MANATRYFDTNGTTAGFGTLTGAWDTTSALWSTSSAGTAATAAYTFDNTDTAQFGFGGTTATAGTATISTGVTVTLNQVVTANLAAGQTIAAGGTGTLNLAGTTPTINVGSAGGLTISAPITGTAGFTKAGAGTLTLSGTSTVSGLTGPVRNSSGILNIYSATPYPAGMSLGQTIPGNPVGGTDYTLLYPTVTGSYSFPAGFTLTDVGSILVSFQNVTTPAAPGFTFPAGATVGLTGTAAGTSSGAAAGLALYVGGSGPQRTLITTLNDFPTGVLSFDHNYTVTNTTHTNYLYYTGAGSTHNYSPRIDIITRQTTAIGTGSFTDRIYANQASGALVLSGNIVRISATATYTTTLELRGTATGVDNTISGNITETSGITAIKKDDANRWILSGANTYTGATTIAAGTLVAASTSAFGSSTSGVVTQTGGTIELASSVNKGSLATTLISNAGATALSLPTSGNSYTYTCGGVTLSSTIIVDVAASSTLTMANSGVMAGVGFGITKNGAGEYILNNTANTFTGAVTVSAGTLSITALANTSSNSSLGTGAGTSAIALTGTLKYIGTIGTSTNRSITFTGAAPVLDASGTVDAATATYSACTQAAGARTITFTGTNAGANTFSAGLADTGVGALVSVSKQGAGKWILSGALTYTGTTTVAAGTLNLGGTNRTLTGALSISGGTLENSTNTVSANTTMTGGTITAELTGAKTLDVNSGSDATLQPTNNANSFSGNTTVAAGGVLKLITGVSPATAATGRVLGTSAVSVSGTIKTGASAPQRGQMRYGGNLTFNSGAVLNIGGA